MRRLISNTGDVFDALTERDDQLRSMIANLDTVFADHGRRATASCRQTFVALPTFQRESRTTLQRLDAFADNTNPLVTQLRPAARELSPTLKDLASSRPTSRRCSRPRPLITASETGFPAAERLLARPAAVPAPDRSRAAPAHPDPAVPRALQARADGVLRQHGGRDAGGRSRARALHYLRTTNPLNPENLAAYPRRIGSNRPNPYLLPGAFDRLAKDLPVFENRHCGRGVPSR